jgi:hypothetical protein
MGASACDVIRVVQVDSPGNQVTKFAFPDDHARNFVRINKDVVLSREAPNGTLKHGEGGAEDRSIGTGVVRRYPAEHSLRLKFVVEALKNGLGGMSEGGASYIMEQRGKR